MTLSGTATHTTGANLAISGNLNVDAGTTLTVANFTIGVTGTTTVGGTLAHSGAAAKTYTGAVGINNGGSWTNAGNAAIAFGNNLTNNGSFASGTGVQTFNGNNAILTHSGTAFNAGTGSFTMSGTTQQIVCDATHGFTIPTLTSTAVTNNCLGGLTVSTSLAGTLFTQGANANLYLGGTSGITTLTATAAGNTVNYNGAAQTVKGATYNNLTLSGSSTKTMTGVSTINGDLTLSGTTTGTLGAALAVGGNVNIGAGTTLDVSALNYALSVKGTWTRTGTFTSRAGTVTFNGTGAQTINSANTWYGLAITGSTARTVSFQSGVAQTIAANGSLTLTGAASNLLTLAPITPASPWLLNVNATGVTQSISYASPSYSNAGGGNAVFANDGTSVNGGNNTNWVYGTPTVTGVVPSNENQGVTRDVTISGTNFFNGAVASFSGTGITVNSTTYVNPTTLTVNITIAPAATGGARNVTVTVGSANSTLTNGFTVNRGPSVDIYTAATASTWIAPVGVTSADVACWGAGGAGGQRTTATAGAGGGGGGAYAKSTVAVTPLASYPVVVGAAGTSGNPGTNGGNSTFASTVVVAEGGKTPAQNATAGGVGGLAANSTGSVKFNGGYGFSYNTGAFGAGGGGSAGPGSNGTNVSATNATSATGAGAVTGGGPGGAGRDASSGVGLAPTSGPGGGGGGAYRTTAATSAGGAGWAGQCTVTYILPAHTVTSASPNAAHQGAVNYNVTINGTNFMSGATVSFSGTGITVNSTTYVSATQLQVNITIAGGATLGSRDVSVTSSNYLATGAGVFTVLSAPTVVSTSSGAGQGTINKDITIIGSSFVSGAIVTFSGTGITVNSSTYVDATTVIANITVAAGATTGARNVTVTFLDGAAATGTGIFTITAAPTVTSTTPNTRGQGAVNQNITIAGTGFVNGATASFGPGIQVNSVTWNSATSLTANIELEATVTTGLRAVSVTNPDGGTGSGSVFTVAVGPTVSNSGSLIRGNTANVTISGANFDAAGATVAFSGVGITINSYGARTATTISVNITIAAGAVVGPRDVTVANPNNGGSGLGVGVFVVAGGPAPTITTPLVPNTALQGQNNLNVTINGTNFQKGAVVTFSGAGITLNGTTTYVSATQLIANISVATGATAAAGNVTVTNPDTGAITANGSFTITAYAACTAAGYLAPTVSFNPAKGTTFAGSNKVYNVTIINNDNSRCAASTFALSIGSESGSPDTSSFTLPSVLGSASTGALAPGARYSTTLTTAAKTSAAGWHVLTTPINAADATNHTGKTGSSSIATTVSPNRLLHNSVNSTAMGSRRNYWSASGGWGIPGGQYGEFTCSTCHVKTTTNIKRVKNTVITAPTSTHSFPAQTAGLAPVFTSTKNNADGFGDDQTTHATSQKICEVCHSQQPFHKFNETDVNLHENSAASPSNYQDCIECHQHKNGFALPGCIDCHDKPQGNRAPVVGQFSANSHHIQGVELQNTHCYECHWEANENGSINSTYHLGWRNGAPSVPGAAVDLVVWGANTLRPTVYTGNNVQYIASLQTRAELAKVNTHCIGCHNDANLNTQPFDDGKKTSQYAWDGSSVDARYSQAATAGAVKWGKYTTTTNAAQKNINKEYTPHFRPDTNQRGWDTTNGVDGAITDAKTGTQTAVLCFDCHNSHGSSVSGTTTAYTSAATNGGIFKDVTTGLGGYTVTYKPQASTGSNRVIHNAGAGLCFDCHMTQTGGVMTPWGYNNTFGATASIIGYWEKPGWKGAAGTNPSGPQMRFPYKNNIGTAGGHFGASMGGISTTPMGTINGLCTPCHDPHGVTSNTAKIASADKQYALPILKGTWVTSPYKEEAAPAATNLLTGDSSHVGNGALNTPYSGRSDPGHRLDQYTFGAITAPNWQWDDYVAAGVTQTDAQFGGLCLSCHPKSDLTDGVNKNTSWKSKDRIHETVKGWGANARHKFTCSKCHTPHSSCLPRLMVSNCLDYKHRGRIASGGAAGSFSYNAGRDGAGQGRFPSGGGGHGNNITTGTGGPYYYGNSGTGSNNTLPALVNCHNDATLGGTAFPSSQLWNTKTPW